MYMKYNAVLRGQNGGANKWNRSADQESVPFLSRSPSPTKDSGVFAEMHEEFVRLCKQNLYATTLHAINSAVIKLGKLMKVKKVYRGLSEKKLPKDMLIPDRHGVRGGVEVRPHVATPISHVEGTVQLRMSAYLVQYGFMSTSTKRDVAIKYAKDGKGNSMLYEIQMGMIDRGADLSWLSQYEHEEEMCADAEH